MRYVLFVLKILTFGQFFYKEMDVHITEFMTTNNRDSQDSEDLDIEEV